jgi:hypothetical protein
MNWNILHPRAAKRHKCYMCYRIIEPGEVYLKGSAFGEGTAWTWYECLHCEAVRKLYDIHDGGEYNEDMYQEWTEDTRSVTELRAAAGFKMKWRTKLGTLLPIPQKEHKP